MRILAAAALAMAGTAFGLDTRVQWMKYDQAVAQAGMTGRPICVYVAVNPSGSS